MKTLMNFFVAYLILSAIVTGASAQKRFKTILFGKLQGNISSVESIRLVFYEKYISLANSMDNNYDSSVIPDEKGLFFFNLPAHRISKIRQLIIIYKDTGDGYSDYLLNDYVVEPGDRIHLLINVKENEVVNVKASGMGADRKS